MKRRLDPLLLTPNADPSETVELGILDQAIREKGLATVVAIQGLDVRPPKDLIALLALCDSLEAAAQAADALKNAAYELSQYLRRRIIAIVERSDRVRLEGQSGNPEKEGDNHGVQSE